MSLQKDLEIIELRLKREGPFHSQDFFVAVGHFIPLMQAAAQIEADNQIPVVLPLQGDKP